ncbi:MAG: DUF1573 domain-containing protein [Sedimentisphaerales bacterium]|nr:DUF1573 domain-containing protein [Sedimentisphaerales bacterium]
MRQNCLLTSAFIAIGCIMLIFSGCQEQTAKTPEVLSEPNALSPRIQFEETKLDFGQVGPKAINTKELKFKNAGQGILKIIEIVQCCGVFAESDKKEYEPGETGILKVEFHASGVIGIIEKEPIIYSNDPVNRKITLSVKAEIMQKVVWEPENIKLYLNEENAACPKLTIKSVDGQEFAITGIRSTGNCITADYNRAVKKTEHVLDLKVNVEKLPEQLYGEINISMNHPQGESAAIPFNVVPKYKITPNVIILNNLIMNESKKEEITIISNYKEDFEIESSSSENKTIKMIDFNKIENGYKLNIEIIPPPITKGELRFNDIFKINLKGGEQLALTCVGYYKIK